MTAEDLLRRTLRYLQKTDHPNALAEDIEWYLMEPKNEPVAWTNENELGCLKEEIACYMYAEPVFNEGNIPLYLHPPTKTAPMKPMTDAEILKEWQCHFYDDGWIGFEAGVRFAERHHGIGRPRRRSGDRQATVPLRRGSGVRADVVGGRDQPYPAEDPSGVVGGDAGASGDGGWEAVRSAASVLRVGDAEPVGDGGDVRVA